MQVALGRALQLRASYEAWVWSKREQKKIAERSHARPRQDVAS